jgi:mono/diheme cytochrome c family protein
MNKKVTQIISLMAVFGCATIAFTSCEKHDSNSPGVEYMPDMYRSPSFETNLTTVIKNADGTLDTIATNRTPAQGTIARGFMPYPFPNTPDGYEQAKMNAHNPLERNDLNLTQGEELYGKFCVHCHGATGQGDGAVGLKLPGAPPAYTAADKINMTEGEIFQIITYGKGLMGSHASQVNQEERWKLVLYVQKLQHPDGMAPVAATDSTAMEKEVKVKKHKK